MTSDTTPPIAVRDNPEEHRFEAVVDGKLCRAEYRREGDVLAMTHTEVAQGLENRGVARELVRYAVEFARSNHLRIAPRCSYVRGYIERHPETQDVLA